MPTRQKPRVTCHYGMRVRDTPPTKPARVQTKIGRGASQKQNFVTFFTCWKCMCMNSQSNRFFVLSYHRRNPLDHCPFQTFAGIKHRKLDWQTNVDETHWRQHWTKQSSS